MNQQFDIVIAGSGPAGCAVAISLRHFNFSVVVIDEVNPKQLKVGESIPSAVQRLLYKLGISGIDQLLPTSAYHSCYANESAWGMEHWITKDGISNPEGNNWQVSRNEFDEALRDVAVKEGVVFKSDKVTKVSEYENDTHLFLYHIGLKKSSEILKGKWFIDASGRSANLLKQLGAERLFFEKQFAAIVWLKMKEKDKLQTTRIKTVKHGWWYTSKLPNNLRVVVFHGMIKEVSYYKKNKEKFNKALDQSGLLPFKITPKDYYSEIVVKDASISKLKRVNLNRCLAVGDAALAFDPISSQGIFFALYSGIKVAEVITKNEKTLSNDFTVYQKAIDKVFEANQQARKYYYSLEKRFKNQDYWKQYALVSDELLNN